MTIFAAKCPARRKSNKKFKRRREKEGMADEIKEFTEGELLELVGSQKGEFIIFVDIEHTVQRGVMAGDGQDKRK